MAITRSSALSMPCFKQMSVFNAGFCAIAAGSHSIHLDKKKERKKKQKHGPQIMPRHQSDNNTASSLFMLDPSY